MLVGVGTQGGFINLSAPDESSRIGSIPMASTIFLNENKRVD